MKLSGDMIQYQQYFERLRLRAEQRERERLDRFREYRRMAARAARGVGRELDASAVYLVGSMCDSEAFDLTSDIDFALEGVRAAQYLETVRIVEEALAGRPFDVILLDSLTEEERARLKSEGEVLYARQKRFETDVHERLDAFLEGAVEHLDQD